MQRGASAGAKGGLPGVWATIAAAFSALLVVPAPALLPVAVDAYLALGPRFAPTALTDPLATLLERQARQGAPEAAALAEQVAGLGQRGDLAAAVGWFVPSLLAGVDRLGVAGASGRAVVAPPAGLVVLLWGAFVLLGIAGSMLLRVMLARIVRDRPIVDRRLPAEALVASARYLGFLALAAGAALLAAVPAGIAAFVLALLGPALLGLVGLVVTGLVFVAGVLFAFVAEAIVLVGAGPLRAVRLSVDLVRRHVWPALGLLLVLWTVLFLVPEPLSRLTGSGPGLAVAVAVYAFVATGIALARMQFVADRLPTE